MAKQENLSTSSLQPGDVVKLSDITELPMFEDLVADQIDPTMSQAMRDAWSGRIAIRDLVRPPKFNGTIAYIELVTMDNPYDRLSNARERSWVFNSKGGVPNKIIEDERVIGSFIGFTFLAEARSSGRGVIGQIQAELYYGRVPYEQKRESRQLKNGTTAYYDYSTKRTAMHAGASVQRYVTTPKIEREKFMELDENARRIGLAVLHQNTMHPIVQPIRN